MDLLRSAPAWLAFSLFVATARADVGAPDERDASLLALCGPGDEVLAEVAGRLARRKLGGASSPAADEITEELRDAGATFPSARMLALAGAEVRGDETAQRLKRWVSGTSGRRRCGVGSADDGRGHGAIVVLAAPAFADVTPVPSVVRPGAWVTIDALLAPEATGARVLVLGPSGGPRSLLASHHDGRVVARFVADRPGKWLAQIVAELDDGPHPVAEVVVRAGAGDAAEPTVPGASEHAATDAGTLRAMLSAARASEGLAALAADGALDRLAARHAAKMAERGLLAHDAGGGDPADRVEGAGIVAREVGENVAHAASLAAAHRMIWASPSHRVNVLSRRFDTVGIGVTRGKDGSVWCVELFVAR